MGRLPFFFTVRACTYSMSDHYWSWLSIQFYVTRFDSILNDCFRFSDVCEMFSSDTTHGNNKISSRRRCAPADVWNNARVCVRRSTTWWTRLPCTCSAALGACWPPACSPKKTTTARPTTVIGRAHAAAPCTGERTERVRSFTTSGIFLQGQVRCIFVAGGSNKLPAPCLRCSPRRFGGTRRKKCVEVFFFFANTYRG